ncbi:MAG: hypothetical protein JWP51_121 [Bradyrhizobium sp.]|jgi:hypothetical protein|nr:hypothetical protein [Bradyrhizobium sp.]
MVRSAATPRVSNHEANGYAAMILIQAKCAQSAAGKCRIVNSI